MQHPSYEMFAEKCGTLASEILRGSKIRAHAVTFRAKSIDSFADKLARKDYTNPKNAVHDLAGVRLIMYVDEDVARATDLLRKNFVVIESESVDKSKTLAADRVGYRSIHLVARLSDARVRLPEYAPFSEYVIEFQICTILQHTWAEIEHDRGYKTSGALPDDLRRRLSVLAGTLELLDREFDAVVREIDRRSSEQVGNQDTLNSINTKSVFLRAFPFLDDPERFVHQSTVSADDLQELSDFGVRSVGDLRALIPKDFATRALEELAAPDTNYISILRTLMIVSDAIRYFERAWEGRWHAIEPDDPALITLKRYGVDQSVVARFVGPEFEGEVIDDEELF